MDWALVAYHTKQTRHGISYTRREGTGTPLVLLHGIGSNALSFQPLIQALPRDLDVIAWNAPGYMGSTPLDAPWPMAQDYARALAAFLDEVASGPVHVLGHSLGTLVVASFAGMLPNRIASLTLASAACGYQVPAGGALPPKVQARIDDLRTLGPEAFARRRAANLVHAPSQNPDLVAQVQTEMAKVSPEGYAQAVHMLASGDLPKGLAHVQTQPHFIIGSEDRVTPVEQTHRAAQTWAQASGTAPEVTEIAGAGHAVYVQKPAEVSAALQKAMAQGRGEE